MPAKEFFYVFLLLLLLLTLFVASAFLPSSVRIYFSLFSIILGSSLVIFGFWGADYAFSTALGELNQSERKGKVKGKKGEVYVPFMRNYTATEWWNLNWALTAIGACLLGLGMFVLGSSIQLM